MINWVNANTRFEELIVIRKCKKSRETHVHTQSHCRKILMNNTHVDLSKGCQWWQCCLVLTNCQHTECSIHFQLSIVFGRIYFIFIEMKILIKIYPFQFHSESCSCFLRLYQNQKQRTLRKIIISKSFIEMWSTSLQSICRHIHSHLLCLQLLCFSSEAFDLWCELRH